MAWNLWFQSYGIELELKKIKKAIEEDRKRDIAQLGNDYKIFPQQLVR